MTLPSNSLERQGQDSHCQKFSPILPPGERPRLPRLTPPAPLAPQGVRPFPISSPWTATSLCAFLTCFPLRPRVLLPSLGLLTQSSETAPAEVSILPSFAGFSSLPRNPALGARFFFRLYSHQSKTSSLLGLPQGTRVLLFFRCHFPTPCSLPVMFNLELQLFAAGRRPAVRQLSVCLHRGRLCRSPATWPFIKRGHCLFTAFFFIFPRAWHSGGLSERAAVPRICIVSRRGGTGIQAVGYRKAVGRLLCPGLDAFGQEPLWLCKALDLA